MNLIRIARKHLSTFALACAITTAYAQTDPATSYAGGTGTQEDPYQIATLQQLRRLSETRADWDKDFIQTADIDASDTRNWNIGDHDYNSATPDIPMGFSPIGDQPSYEPNSPLSSFTGSYNGQGYTIDQLYINRPNKFNVGLFGYVSSYNKLIQFLAITNADITGNQYTGILAGETVYTRIANCYTSGSVTGKLYTGGIAGHCGYSQNCYSLAIVNCQYTTAGGLGTYQWTSSETHHQNCYYNSDIYTGSNERAYGYPLTTAKMGIISNYTNWNISVDANLAQGAPPVLVNESGIAKWKMNPSPTHTITFTINNEQGVAIQGASIFCNGEVITDANGKATCLLLPNSTEIYTVIAPGMENTSGSVSVTDNDTSLEISLKPAYAGGKGTDDDPYLIATLNQLRNLSLNTRDWNASFAQTADIDASATKNWNVGDHDNDPATPDEPMGFTPIGDGNDSNASRQQIEFKGNYNGKGYAIDQLYINRPKENYVGLFGHASASNKLIQFLAITNAVITGKSNTGILAGKTSSTHIANCYTSGSVTGSNYCGGLTGKCGYSQKCYSVASVICQSTGKGGLGTDIWGTNETYHQNSYYNSDVYTGSNEQGFGYPLSTDKMGVLSNYENWNIDIDASLVQGAPPVLVNESGIAKWKMNPSPTHTITFTIIDEQRIAIEGAKIFCNGEATTDAYGKASVQILLNSTEEYIVMAPGMINNSGSVTNNDENIEISLNYAYAGGKGTNEDPYLIETLDHLRNLSANTLDWNASFVQTADINASDSKNWNIGDHDNNPDTPNIPMGFTPIGDGIDSYASRQQIAFSGSYNGQGYTIDQLYINRPKENYIGLFGCAHATNQLIQSLAITNTEITGNRYTGILAGNTIYTKISNCYTTGNITGNNYSGGLIGQCGYAKNCYSQATVNCKSYYQGGLGTYIWPKNGTYHLNCYYNSYIYSASNDQGFGFPLTLGQMQQQASFENWDFTNESHNGTDEIWAISPAENNGYPYFARGRQAITLTISADQTDFSASSQAFPLQNMTGLPAMVVPQICYRLNGQTPEAEWNNIAPSNAGSYDVKISIKASDTHLAGEFIAEKAWTINKISPSISFAVLDTKTFGDAAFELPASTTGDGQIVYTSGNENVATINGNMLTIVGAGSAEITASVAETSNYHAATSVTQTLTVNKGQAVITFDALNDKTYGDATFELLASTTSDGQIVYTSGNENVATINGNMLTIVGAGSAEITASVAETSNYHAATSVTHTLTVNKGQAVITFDALNDKTYGDTAFELSASTTGDGQLVYTSGNEKVATINGNMLTIVGAGSAEITASVAETSNYYAAASVTQTLIINKAIGNISWSINNTTINASSGDEPFFLTNASSTMPDASISYHSDNTDVATIDASTGEVTIIGAGSCTITVTAEAANYHPAMASVYLSVSAATQLSSTDQNKIDLYPNPATTTICIKGAEREKITIYTLSGQKVMEQSQATKIDVSKLKRGIYILRAGEKYTEKIILK